MRILYRALVVAGLLLGVAAGCSSDNASSDNNASGQKQPPTSKKQTSRPGPPALPP